MIGAFFAAAWAKFTAGVWWIFTLPKRLLSISLAGQIGWLVGLFLFVCVVIVAVAIWRDPKMVPWFHWLTPGYMAMIIGLMIAIPVVVYKALKLWLEGEVSRFPDIDYAWKSGMDELAKNGIAITETPLFLILGSASEQQERSLMAASRLSLRVRQSPQGPAALHWYANPDGIYLMATEASVLSKIAWLGKQKGNEYLSSAVESPVPSSSGGRGNIRGTIVIGQQQDEPAEAPAPRSGGGSSNIRGTMVLGGGGGDIRETLAPVATTKPRQRVAQLPPQEANEQALRLQYLCQLLRRARAPLCAANGVLAMLPFDVIENGGEQGQEVQRAVQTDLGVALDELGVRCPVIALVVGMETEPGFSELVHRVGQERAVGQRFGKGFHVWTPPEPEQLEALTAHACGAFEDWVYTLFKERGSLSRPGNTKLYAMLCKIRRNLSGRLTNIITTGFGQDSEKNPSADSLLFSGCYFAATGDNDDQQAFVKGVFDKLVDEQEELEWSRAALAKHRRYQRLAYVGITLDVLLAASLAGMILYRTFVK